MVRVAALAGRELRVAGIDCDWPGAASSLPFAKSGRATRASAHACANTQSIDRYPTDQRRFSGSHTADQLRGHEPGWQRTGESSGGGQGSGIFAEVAARRWQLAY